MNNRTLWQLTADGVSELRASPNEQRCQYEEIYKALEAQLVVLGDKDDRRELVIDMKLQVERVIKEHSFELSSKGSNFEVRSKVYTIR